MKVTLLETFDGHYRILRRQNGSIESLEFLNKVELDKFLETEKSFVELYFDRKDVQKTAVICITPATEWAQAGGYNFNWWRSVGRK